jgi:subtilase family serine protease
VRRTKLEWVAAAAVTAAGLAATALSSSDHVPRSTRAPVHLATSDVRDTVDFTLRLRLPERRALERFLRDLDDRQSPDYGSFISAREFGRRFGVSHRELAQLERRLAQAGLRVIRSYDQRTALEVRGTIGEVNRFLGIDLQDFRSPSGERYRAALEPIGVPVDLRRIVAGISGFGPRPAVVPAALPARGMQPADAAKAYGIEPLWKDGLRGQGQTVAIVSFDTFVDGDVGRYDRLVGISGAPPVEKIPVRGKRMRLSERDSTVEVNLDIDIIRGIAPQAKILNYEAPNNDVNGDAASFAEVINRIVDDGRADIVSISWGVCDVPESISRARRAEDEAALDAARAQGITIFVATGDAGAYECGRYAPEDDRVSVSWPASSPNVVAVGGTLLFLDREGRYVEEAGWEDVLSRGGTGGGDSPVDPRPAWQQAPGLGRGARRSIPDVAASADCDSAFFVAFTDRSGTRHEGPFGCGTSAAAPLWAGVTALVRQLAERDRQKLPHLNPILYELARDRPKPSPFHDVVRGGNRLHNAGPGWDYATGLGTPDAAVLARAIVDRVKRR